MAILGSAEVEIRADVRRLGKDITDSLKGLEKQADQIGERLGKSITDSLNNLDGLTLRVDIDQDYFLDQARQVEDTMGVLSDEAVNIKVEVDADEILDLAVLLEDLSGTVQLDIDQDHFSRQVLFAEDTLGNLMDSEVPVTITADTDSLMRLAQDVRNIVDSIPEASRTVTYEPKIAPGAQRTVTSEVSKVLDQARAAADNFDFEMSVDADIDEAQRTLEELKKKIEDKEIEIGITYSKADLEQLNSAIETVRLYNEANDIELGVDVHIAKAMAQLELLTKDRRMNIFPQIGGKFVAESAKIFSGLTGINVMREDFRKFVDSLTQLDERLGPLAMQLAGLSAAVPTAGALGGWAVTLLGDIGSLSGLLVPLAGILGGATIGFGTLALALSGTGDRLKDLNPTFERFRDTISNTYWGVAEKPFRDMVSKVLPPLQTELKTTATALGEMSESLFDAVVNIALSKDGAGAFSTVVGNTNTAIKRLGPAFEPFLRGLLNVSAIGSQYLPDLSDWIVKIGEQFEAWSKNTPEIEQWAEDAIEVMKALFSILGSTVGIMKTFYNVAKTVGFPGVRELADGFERVNEALKQPENIKYMEDLGRSVMTAFGSITDGLSWIGPLIGTHSDGINTTLETMGRIVGSVLEGIGSMLTNTGLVDSFFGLFDSLETAVTAFEPVWENLGTIFAVTLDALGVAFEQLTPIFVEFFDNLENDAKIVKPILEDVLEVIGQWGPGIMEMVGEVTGAIFEFIASLSPYTVILGALFMAVLPAIGIVGGALMAVVTAVGGFLGSIGTISAALGGPATAIEVFTAALARIGPGGFGQALAGVSRFIPGIGLIIGVLISAFAASEDLRKAVGDFLVNAFKAVAAFIEPLIGPIKELFGAIGEIAAEVGQVLAPALESLFGLLNTLWPIVQLVAKVIGEVFGASITVAVGILKGAWAFISNILGGAVTLISGVFDGVAGIIEGIIDLIVGWFTGNDTLVVDGLKKMFDGVLEVGQALFDGVAEMVMGALTGIVEFIQEFGTGMMEAIKGVFDGFGLSDAGLAIIDSLIEGFQNGLQAVIDWLVGLTQAIIDSKGPPEKDATLLTAAGESIINSLIQGFKNAVAAVFTFLQGLTQSIVDVVMNIVNSVVGFFQTGWGMLVTVVQTVWNGIVLIIQTVLTTVMTVVQTYINLVVTIFQTGWSILTTVVQTVWNFIVTIIQTVFTTIMTVIQTYITIVVTIFQTGWNILTTVIQAVWLGIQTVIQAAWATIQIIIQTALTIVVTIFTTIWNTVLTVVMTVWTAISNAINIAITTVQTIIATVMTSIMLVITTIWNTIKTVTMTVWNGIKALIQLGLAAIKAIFTGNFAAFQAIIQTAWNVIKSTTQAVWNAIKSAISSIINTIRSTIQSVFNAIRSTITSIMNGIRSTIQSVWNTIRSAISSAVNTVRSVVTSAFNAVRSIITSVMNAARSIISSVWSSIRSTISSAVSSVRSTVSSGFNALRGIVTSAWNAVVSAVTSAVSRMMSIVKSIPGKIKGALGNLGGLLKGAGRSIIQGLIDGVSGMIGSLRDKFSGITNMIPDWKGPPDTDAKLLTNAGELIMEGLISGLESKYGAVKNSLQTFTGDLSQTVGTQIGAEVGITTAVRNTALSDAERRLSYRSNAQTMVQSNGERDIHLHFYQPMANEDEIIMAVNRQLGRG